MYNNNIYLQPKKERNNKNNLKFTNMVLAAYNNHTAKKIKQPSKGYN